MKNLFKFVVFFWFIIGYSAHAGIPVLMYHNIDSEPTSWTISLEKFVQQIDYIKSEGYTTLTINELSQIMNGKRKEPKKAIVLTFDDGWKNVLKAADIVKSNDMSATFFIITSTFNRSIYLSKEEILALASNKKFEIGAHSHTHFVSHADHLTTEVDTSMLVGEAMMSKLLLEDVLGKKVTSMAWPYGYTNDDAINFVTKLGYTSTVLVVNGINNVGDTPSKIKRLNVDGRCDFTAFKKMLETNVAAVCQ